MTQVTLYCNGLPYTTCYDYKWWVNGNGYFYDDVADLTSIADAVWGGE